jgi:hypothetical protein
VWENRRKGDEGNDCMVSVDGTDCRVEESGRQWYSHKFKGSGVHYEVAVSMKAGHIVRIKGSLPCWLLRRVAGHQVFRDALIHYLDEDEHVEADDGYRGESLAHVKCPKMFPHNEQLLTMQQHVFAINTKL